MKLTPLKQRPPLNVFRRGCLIPPNRVPPKVDPAPDPAPDPPAPEPEP